MSAARVPHTIGHLYARALQRIISRLSPACRKVWLSICRIQPPALSSPQVQQHYRDQLDQQVEILHPHNLQSGTYHCTLRVAIDLLPDSYQNPIRASFCSMLLRNTPYQDVGGLYDAMSQALAKEVDACLSPEDSVPIFNFRPIFHADDPAESLQPCHPNLIPNRGLHLHLNRRLRSWKEDVSNRVLFPHYSRTKNVAYNTGRLLLRARGYYCLDEEGDDEVLQAITLQSQNVTSLDLEVFWSEHGLHIDGDEEIRLVLRWNDISPRAYFAFGGTFHHYSKFIRTPANLLVDILPSTHRTERFQTNVLNEVISPEMWLVLHDYESFTSKFRVMRTFMQELAEYCSDTTVVVFDSYHGFTRVNLGEMLKDYNANCNTHGLFTLERFGDMSSYAHRTAGFLGVYGNIAFCTFIHGLVLLLAVQGDNLSRCVGDDAIWLCDSGQEYERIISVLCDAGSLNPDKSTIFDDRMDPFDYHPYKYLKRPIDRVAGRVFTGVMVDFPSYASIVGLDDGVHVQFKDLNYRRKSFIMQSIRLLAQIKKSCLVVSAEDRELIGHYASFGYSYFGLDPSGNLPTVTQHRLRRLMLAVPPLRAFYNLEFSWLEDLLRETEEGLVFPEVVDRTTAALPDSWEPGFQFKSVQDPFLKILVDLGYLQEEFPRKVEYENTEYNRLLFRMFLDSQVVGFYSYTILRTPPAHLLDVPDEYSLRFHRDEPDVLFDGDADLLPDLLYFTL